MCGQKNIKTWDGQQLHPIDSLYTVPLKTAECCGKFGGLLCVYSCGDPRICKPQSRNPRTAKDDCSC